MNEVMNNEQYNSFVGVFMNCSLIYFEAKRLKVNKQNNFVTGTNNFQESVFLEFPPPPCLNLHTKLKC